MKEFNIHQSKTLTLKYLALDAVDACLAQHGNRVACVVGFDSSTGAYNEDIFFGRLSAQLDSVLIRLSHPPTTGSVP